jgi:hypothetical protein
MTDNAIEAGAEAAMRALHGDRYASLQELEPTVADEFRAISRAVLATSQARSIARGLYWETVPEEKS